LQVRNLSELTGAKPVVAPTPQGAPMPVNGRSMNSDHRCNCPAFLERISIEEIQQLTVDELVRKCGYSRRHLTRLFQDYFGCSVIAAKIELQLEKASGLLRQPDAKVGRVSAQCGFGSLGLFNSVFKKRFGMTPVQWRQNLLKVNH